MVDGKPLFCELLLLLLLVLLVHVLLVQVLLGHHLVLGERVEVHLLVVKGEGTVVSGLVKEVLLRPGHLMSAVEALVTRALRRERLLRNLLVLHISLREVLKVVRLAQLVGLAGSLRPIIVR